MSIRVIQTDVAVPFRASRCARMTEDGQQDEPRPLGGCPHRRRLTRFRPHGGRHDTRDSRVRPDAYRRAVRDGALRAQGAGHGQRVPLRAGGGVRRSVPRARPRRWRAAGRHMTELLRRVTVWAWPRLRVRGCSG